MYRIVYLPGSKRDLRKIWKLIKEQSSDRIADDYLDRIGRFCEDFAIAPHRGEHRPELKAGQRTIGFERRISIVFRVSDADREVVIVSFHYAGKSLKAAQQNEL